MTYKCEILIQYSHISLVSEPCADKDCVESPQYSEANINRASAQYMPVTANS